jgi:hypothetical protein
VSKARASAKQPRLYRLREKPAVRARSAAGGFAPGHGGPDEAGPASAAGPAGGCPRSRAVGRVPARAGRLRAWRSLVDGRSSVSAPHHRSRSSASEMLRAAAGLDESELATALDELWRCRIVRSTRPCYDFATMRFARRPSTAWPARSRRSPPCGQAWESIHRQPGRSQCRAGHHYELAGLPGVPRDTTCWRSAASAVRP